MPAPWLIPLLTTLGGMAYQEFSTQRGMSQADKARRDYEAELEESKQKAIDYITKDDITIIKDYLSYIYPMLTGQAQEAINVIDRSVDDPRMKAFAVHQLMEKIIPQVSREGLGQAIGMQSAAEQERSRALASVETGISIPGAENVYGSEMWKVGARQSSAAGQMDLLGSFLQSLPFLLNKKADNVNVDYTSPTPNQNQYSYPIGPGLRPSNYPINMNNWFQDFLKKFPTASQSNDVSRNYW